MPWIPLQGNAAGVFVTGGALFAAPWAALAFISFCQLLWLHDWLRTSKRIS